jgi:hypothetical protein
VCVDDVHPLINGKRSDGALLITRYIPSGELTSGTPVPGVFYLVNCPVAWNGFDPPRLSGSGTLASQKNRVLSGSGPLSANIHLPVFLFEMRDIPKMLRHAGNLLHKIKYPSGLNPLQEVASANLAYQFGWKPLIQDLNKLTGFGELVKKKQDTLNKINQRGGIKRRIKLGSDRDTATGTQLVHSTFSISINPKYIDTMSYERWATIRWSLKDASQLGAPVSWTEAMRTTLGLNKGHIPIEIWKAMPWSWIIDWFTDISNVLEANYNSIYYRPSNLCIMEHSISERRFLPSTHNFPGLTKHVEWKERWVDSAPVASVNLRIPFMDAFKLSILGSLTIQKLYKKR